MTTTTDPGNYVDFDEYVGLKLEKTRSTIRTTDLLTAGAGVARVVEVDAAANVHNLPRILAQDGLYVVYGSGRPSIPFEFAPMIMRGAGVRFFIVYELSREARQHCCDALNGFLKAGLLKHAVSQTFSIDDIAAAHEAVERAAMPGNVVVTLAN